MSRITPTVGRSLLYVLANTTSGFAGNGGQECACILADVNDDGTINVCVFDANGMPHPRQRVRLMQDGESAPGGDYCKWMPFQVGQAKKTEALESELAMSASMRGVIGANIPLLPDDKVPSEAGELVTDTAPPAAIAQPEQQAATETAAQEVAADLATAIVESSPHAE